MIKNIHYLPALTLILTLTALLFSFTSCYDDTEIRDQIDDLSSKVAELERLTSQMNTNISTLQTALQALQNNDYVTSIAEVKESNKIIGYVLTFVKSGPVTIYHGQNGQDGKDGKDGIDGQNGQNGQDGKDGIDGQDGKDGIDGSNPIIGVKMFTDNIYYWTLNNEWLTDGSGNKIRAIGLNGSDGQDGQDGQDGKDGADGKDGQDGANGITPKLKIESGNWYVSTDNELTWTYLGVATGRDGIDGKDGKDGSDGDSFFQSVTQDDDNVYLVLANSTTITLPKVKPLSISFSESDISITAGGRAVLYYIITGATENTVVKAMGQNGWSARVEPIDNTIGEIIVTAPNPMVEDEILVWVYDGESKTIMSSINFVKGSVLVTPQINTVLMGATTFPVDLDTDVSYIIDIPESARSWLSVESVRPRSAMVAQSIRFTVTENDGFTRYAVVSIKNNGGVEQKTIAVEQIGRLIEDVDGNIYTTVQIGDQQWFAENLRTIRLNDSTLITNVIADGTWVNTYTPAYSWYNNDPDSIGEAYGPLYNWYSVNTGKLCPKGWRVPSPEDWDKLSNNTGGFTVSGGRLKSTRTEPDSHPRWNSPNTYATDLYGFGGLPGGFRTVNADFSNIGITGYWWTSEAYDESTAKGRELSYDRETMYMTAMDKRSGNSIRCVRD